MRRRALIFNPGLAVLGGGERYMVALGNVIAESHDVTYATSGPLPEGDALRRHGLPPLAISPLSPGELSRASLDYDLAVAIVTRPPPPLRAAHNLIVVQFPFGPLPVDGMARRRALLRLRRYHRVVYSEFARRWVAQRWEIDSDVLAPAIEIPQGDVPEKERLILAVGRFFVSDHCKRQDVLVRAFSQLPEPLRRSWRLVLVGGYQESPDNAAFVDEVRRAASGLDITIELNASAGRVTELYQRARFFWHATGFGRPPDAPERAEHFGMSTVEAMSHGVIPIVFADGGQVEIVDPEVGVLWETVPELVDRTAALMRCSPSELDARSLAARAGSRPFSLERFDDHARRVVEQCVSAPALPAAGRRAIAFSAPYARRLLDQVLLKYRSGRVRRKE